MKRGRPGEPGWQKGRQATFRDRPWDALVSMTLLAVAFGGAVYVFALLLSP